MATDNILKLLKGNIHELIEPLGFDLIEIKKIAASNGLTIRLFVDRKEGGITLGECAELSRNIGQLIENKDLIKSRYLLEVSSPGLDRWLIDQRDFDRKLDKIIQLFLNEEYKGKKEFIGKLIKVDDKEICIVTDKEIELSIPFTVIHKAKQVI